MRKNHEFNVPKKIKNGKLRVWHKPQVPMNESFYVYVKNIQEADLILDTLAYYDLFQLAYKIKPDYSNASGLEVFEDGYWIDWCDENGDDINETELLK